MDLESQTLVPSWKPDRESIQKTKEMRDLPLIVTIGVMGALGAISRYTVNSWTSQWTTNLPVGTLLVNVVGCFLAGVLAFLAGMENSHITPATRTAIGVGFLGALTTFSTFGLETLDRFSRGQWAVAMANIGANIVLGLFAVWLGHYVIRLCLES